MPCRRKKSLNNSLLAALALFAAPAFAGPKVAIVLDDFGLTDKKNPSDEEWMSFAQPLTFAVMPASPRTKTAAKATLEAARNSSSTIPSTRSCRWRWAQPRPR